MSLSALSGLPREVIGIVTSFAEPEDVASLATTAKRFAVNTILGARENRVKDLGQFLQCLMHSLQAYSTEAQKVGWTERLGSLQSIASLRTVPSITDRVSVILSNTIIFLATYARADLESACQQMAILPMFGNIVQVAMAYQHIMKQGSQAQDWNIIKAFVREKDFTGALMTTRIIEGSCRNCAIRYVINTYIDHNGCAAAKNLARKMEVPRAYAYALQAAADAYIAEGNLVQARIVAKGIETSRERDPILVDIANAYAKIHDFVHAMEVAEAIEERHIRDLACNHIRYLLAVRF